ncbi:PREDICTED: uncharacterized protein LOC105558318 isoform X2 [Vollenhovia emeryi]|uniref:uncharacterized protein LOC105558318 isoform X2 n=1 Tax=Vollenhovia emeryi TaxID=411798 RepID=UPI0005F4F343|nr:PREDICTED: uncharacterized protein LOC105558318 isoform X2 [Vollenhovia emeryi]
MNIFDGHFKLNQDLLRFYGLWPFEKTKFERFRAVCFYILLISAVIIQLAQFVTADLRINVVVKILSDSCLCLIYVINFNIFLFNTKKMLTDPQEIKIVEHYVYQGKNITVAVTLLQICMACTLLMIQLTPDILDFLRPLNESRAHYLLLLSEYHINEGKLFYYIILYNSVSYNIGISSTISISLIFVLSALHCCAIFKICSYRIQHSVDKKVITCFNKKNEVIKRIIKTVELHKNAQKLFKLLTTSFTLSFLLIVVVGMCSFVLNLYRLLFAIISMDDFMEFMIATCYIIGHELYLFGTTFLGQLMVNYADELFITTYMSLWYKTPVKVQKLFLFVMQISSKSVVPNLGGLYVSVMESFTSVMSTAISFMMVIYSIQ